VKSKRLACRLRLAETTQTKPWPLRVVVVQPERDDALPEKIPEDLEYVIPVRRVGATPWYVIPVPRLTLEAPRSLRTRAVFSTSALYWLLPGICCCRTPTTTSRNSS
jgi:hypothetical protein